MQCYISLGSNLSGQLGSPLAQLQRALETIGNDSELNLLKTSSFYRSKALTLSDTPVQNDYINAVAMLETSLSSEQLLKKLNEIELSQGRERIEKWGARTLDLDILLYGKLKVKTDKLIIPHLQIEHRNFVIHPLFEIAGAMDIPGVGDLALLAKKMHWNGLQTMDASDI